MLKPPATQRVDVTTDAAPGDAPGTTADAATHATIDTTHHAAIDTTTGATVSARFDAAPVFDHAWIARHIPHQGAMCLLDHVIEWDEHHIVCVATSHRDPAHPLRYRDQLSAVVAIEYAAQAMAAHGAAIAGRDSAPAVGFLTAIRNVRFHVDRLDTVPGALRCEATRLSGDARNILYAFDVSAGADIVAQGRATVMLDADDTLGIR